MRELKWKCRCHHVIYMMVLSYLVNYFVEVYVTQNPLNTDPLVVLILPHGYFRHLSTTGSGFISLSV